MNVPRWAAALLARIAPPDRADDVLGDLEETHRDRVHRRGAWLGSVLTALEALDMAVVLLRERKRGGRRAGGRVESEADAMRRWLEETRRAARTLARRPSFAAAVVVTLGLGLGANAAIFAVVHSVLIEPLPYPESERIVAVRHHAPGVGLEQLNASPGMVDLYHETARSFSALALVDARDRNLTGGDRPARVRVVEASPDFFGVIGVQPARGRAFGAADVESGAAPVAVLTHAGWRASFGGDPGIVGRTVEFDGRPTRVVGVMPEGFHYPDPETVALLPLRIGPNAAFGDFGNAALARLKPGVTIAEARREAAALQRRIPERFPEIGPDFLERAGWSVSVTRLRELEVEDVTTVLWVILGTVGFVLLIACAGVANLFLVRAEGRGREMAIRAALGAGRGRIFGAFLSESVLLGAGAAAVGMALAAVGVRAIVAAGPAELPRLHEVGIESATLVYTAGLSLVAALALGALPVTRQLGASLARGLRAGRSDTGSREDQRTRKVLIAAQVAMALVLLTGSGLMLRSFQRLRAVDPGLRPENVLTIGLSLGDYESAPAAASFYQAVLERVRALPDVEAAGATGWLPFLGGSVRGSNAELRSRARGDDGALPRVAYFTAVTPGYFEAAGIRRVAGRPVERADHEYGRPVAWVNETFAREFAGGDIIGEQLRFGEDSTWLEVVGVIGDVRAFGLGADVRPTVYLPMTVLPERNDLALMHLFVRTDAGGGPLAVLPSVRAAVSGVRADIPLTTARTVEDLVARSMAQTSFTMIALAIAAAVALFLGAVGLYGVISYSVSRRSREIGLRVALGALPRDVRRLVIRQGVGVIAVGVAVGIAASLASTRVLARLLFGISAADPVTFGAAAGLLVAVGLLASYLPARRASAVDPLDVLHAD